MVTAQVIEGHWNDISGKLKERWGQLTGDEWQEAEGQLDQLVGIIQSKTGEARENIESYLEEITGCEGSQFTQRMRETAEQAAHKARETAEQAAHKARETAEQAAAKAKETFRSGYEHAETHVQQHPGRSLAIAFGVGLAAGLLLTIRRK